LVENVLVALQQLASLHRNTMKIPIIAITGTNGKTTTKELINAVLSTSYSVDCTQGNHNNHIGVPLTLLSVKPSTDIVIIEMGANHPHEIAFLCDIAKPDFGIITNIGKAHLEGFGNFEGVVATKNELYAYIKHHNGTLFVNGNDLLLMQLSENIKRITYGTDLKSSIASDIQTMNPFMTLNLNFETQNRTVQTNLIGSYNLNNLLAAACIGTYFKVSPEKIVTALENYRPKNMRSQLEKYGTNTIILDTYNANPDSMKAALENFFAIKAAQKMVILGDMLELGTWSDIEHQLVLKLLSEHKINNVALVGENFEKANYAFGFPVFDDADAVSDFLKNHPVNNTLILIKGSRKMQLEKILKTK
jgi:UDP-N-acetylmuramoyl-tripeptide--D-alanyl-D-alanine ligase